jgi:hypothetical protein
VAALGELMAIDSERPPAMEGQAEITSPLALLQAAEERKRQAKQALMLHIRRSREITILCSPKVRQPEFRCD